MNTSKEPIFHQQTTLPPQTLSSFLDSHPQANTSTQQQQQQPPQTHTTYQDTPPEQAINMHTRRNNGTVQTRTTKPTLMTRLRGRNAQTKTVKTTTKVEPATAANTRTARRSGGWGRNRRTAHTAPVTHHKRHATIGDKISGAMLKLKGSLTHRPAVKAAGTRRMHGTDGRGSHRVY
jgi:hypothetical protein